MRNETKSSSVPARSTPLESSRRTPPANAFSQAYLLQAPPPEEVDGGPSGLSLAGGAAWAGPWAVEPVGDSCGRLWAVSRLRWLGWRAPDRETGAMTIYPAESLTISTTRSGGPSISRKRPWAPPAAGT